MDLNMDERLHTWRDHLIKAVARGLTTWAAIAWAWGRLRRQTRDIAKQATGEVQKVGGDVKRALGIEKEKTGLQRVAHAPVRALRTLESTGETIMAKKKGWSFFKVILTLGILVAVAVYLLDRILPKPYSDEELDEAWEPEEPYGDEGFSGPAGATGESDNGQDTEEKKSSSSSKKSSGA